MMVTGAGTGFAARLQRAPPAEGANVVVHYNNSKAGADETARPCVRSREAFIVQGTSRAGTRSKR